MAKNDPETALEISTESAAQGEEIQTLETDEGRPPMREISGVRYTSPMIDRKSFNRLDLISLGAVDPIGDLVWSSDNGFVVPKEELNASTVDALIKLPEFSVA